jgi:putative protease
MNIRLYDKELEDFIRDAYRLLCDGADAFIVADVGASRLLHRLIPEAELHASTQLTGETAYDAAAAAEMGFSRMVCPREMTLADVKALVKASPIDIEMFIHGAHCVSVSGQCLASFSMGGRSGNRGECAGPCRLPYGKRAGEKAALLSLRDMCLAEYVPEIIASGVKSLKIEGRQKSADYTAGTVRIYRRLLDEGRAATEDEARQLRELFSRDGFTDGYFRGNMRSMTGTRSDDEHARAQSSGGEPQPVERVEADVRLTLTEKRAVMEMKTRFAASRAEADARERLEGEKPLTHEAAEKNAGRLGATPFVMRSFESDISPDAFFTLSELNGLRRACTERLLYPERENGLRQERDLSYVRTAPGRKGSSAAPPLRAAIFEGAEQITPAAEEFFHEIYLPWYSDRREYGAFLPPLAFGDAAKRAIECAAVHGRVLCHTPGQLKLAAEMGLEAHCSMRLGVFNGESAAVLHSMGASSVTLSPELTLRQAEDIPAERIIVWGRLPLMLLARCVISDGGEKCERKPTGFGGLRHGGEVSRERAMSPCRSALYDRRGEVSPVIGRADCTNIMYNSRPVYMADRLDAAALRYAAGHVYLFSSETPEEVDKVIAAYSSGTPAEDFGGSFRRI